MKNFLNYENFALNESLKCLDESKYTVLEKITLNDIDRVKSKNVGGGFLMTGLRVLFWLSPLFPIMLGRELLKVIRKSIVIRRMLKKETDPEKKAQLKIELKELKDREVRFLRKIDLARTKAEKEAEKLKLKGLDKKLSDEDRKKALDKKKEYSEIRDLIKKEKEKEKNI